MTEKRYACVVLGLMVICGLVVQTEPVICDPSWHHYNLHWNNECPFGTGWNRTVQCCVIREIESGLHPADELAYDYLQDDGSETKCDSAKNFHMPHHGKKCPTGTSWNEKVGCCEGCPLCGPGWRQSPGCQGSCITCEQFHFSSNVINNEKCSPCTNCTALNRHTLKKCEPIADSECEECFTGYENLYERNSYMSQCTQVRNPLDDQCDRTKGYFSVPLSGICPLGTGLDVISQCCSLCHKCPPGYKHAENCFQSCQPCPKDTYSDQAEDNPICHPCLNCHALNRLHKKGCQPIANAECGTCLFGYYEDVHNTEISCLKCQLGNPEPQCEEYLHGHQGETVHHPVNMLLLVIVLCVTAVVICLIVVTSILIYRRCPRQTSNETRVNQLDLAQAEQHEREIINSLVQASLTRNVPRSAWSTVSRSTIDSFFDQKCA